MSCFNYFYAALQQMGTDADNIAVLMLFNKILVCYHVTDICSESVYHFCPLGRISIYLLRM